MSIALADEDPIRPITVQEFYLLWESGCFDGQKVELLDGVIYPTGPQKAPHAGVIVRLNRRLARELAESVELRVQLPLTLSERSEPEPDFAVVLAGPRAATGHPTTAALVVEVSDTSRRRDLVTKLPLYAQAGVTEYWVVDVARDAVHVHQRPAGGLYERTRIVHRGETLVPVAFPALAIAIDEILGSTS